MMLDFLGERAAAQAIENSVIRVTREKIKSLAAGQDGLHHRKWATLVAAAL
jgi:isocitrate/isopropylmalate dehydrogenase